MLKLIDDICNYIEYKEYRKIGMTELECWAALEHQLNNQIKLYGVLNGRKRGKAGSDYDNN